MKLLLIMPTKYLGNMVIALGSVRAVFERAPDATLLIDENFHDFLKFALGDQHRFLVYPRRDVAKGGALERLKRYIRFLVDLRSIDYDLAIDIDGTVVSGRLTRFSRATKKVGPTFAKRLGPYTQSIPVVRETQHCFEDFAVMVEACGFSVGSRIYFTLPRLAPGTCHDHLTALGISLGDRIACIHPCATKDYKQWNIERFAALGDWLAESGFTVVIIGAGDDERERVASMLGAMEQKPINAHGKVPLLPLVGLLQAATLYIGNDSGPMHLAAACGVKAIALFGPTELVRWRPRAQSVRILKGELPCSPECRPEACLNEYQCMRSLTTKQVQSMVLELVPGTV